MVSNAIFATSDEWLYLKTVVPSRRKGVDFSAAIGVLWDACVSRSAESDGVKG